MSKAKEKVSVGAAKPRGADYLKIVEWSEEDGCFVGSAPPIIGGACHGDNEAEVYKELCEIVDEWLEIMDRDGVPAPHPTLGKKYSGKFLLRPGPALHKALDIRATQEGESLNSYCMKKLEFVVGPYSAKSGALCDLKGVHGDVLLSGKCEMSAYSFGDNFFFALGTVLLTEQQERAVRYAFMHDGSSYEVTKFSRVQGGQKGKIYTFRAKRIQ